MSGISQGSTRCHFSVKKDDMGNPLYEQEL